MSYTWSPGAKPIRLPRHIEVRMDVVHGGHLVIDHRAKQVIARIDLGLSHAAGTAIMTSIYTGAPIPEWTLWWELEEAPRVWC